MVLRALLLALAAAWSSSAETLSSSAEAHSSSRSPAEARSFRSKIAWSDDVIFGQDEIEEATAAIRSRMAARAWTNCSRWVANRHQTTKHVGDTCYLLPPLKAGVRPLIYHMVRKAGSTSTRQGLSDLSNRYRGVHLPGKPLACTHPSLVRAREEGRAFEFGVSREPLDKFLSAFHYLGHDVPKNGSVASSSLDLLVSYVDRRADYENNAHAFQQSFFYCGSCNSGDSCGTLDAVLTLEAPAEFNALFAIAYGDADGGLSADLSHFRQRHDAPLPPRVPRGSSKVGAPEPTPRQHATPEDRLALLEALPPATRTRLCALLRVDYDLFPWYPRPAVCAP